KLDGANLGAEVTTSPYSILWATAGVANGAHTLTAVARDTANNTATSSSVTVTVSNAPPPTLSINDVSVNQAASGTTNAVFTVTLSAASAQTVTVVYGTATAGTDYVATAGNLSFSPGTTAQTIAVQISGDPTPEANETFVVNLSAPAGATIAKAQGTGTIVGPPAQKVVWTNAVGVSVAGNSLTKTATAGWNAGASSTTALLSGDGYVELTVSETSSDRMLGLSTRDVDQNYTSIGFAAYLASSGALQVYEMGVSRGSFGTYATGDVVRVAVESGVVTYRRNGVLLYTSTAASYPLLVDTSLSTTGATLANVVVSANWAVLPPPPTAPTNLTATAASTGQINLSWTNTGTSQTGVKVERSVDNVTFTQITIAGATAVSYSDTGLNSSTTYSYRVRATNVSGDSPYSAAASVATLAPLPPPTAPTNLVAAAAGSGQINLSWANTSTTQTGVKVERSIDNATFTQITVAGATAVSYSDIGLSASTTYFYRARATNAAGDSSYSTTASAATTSRAIAFVQKNYATPQAPVSAVRVAFSAAQSAGNLNLVVVGWNDTKAQVASVTDTKGNPYQLAVGPTAFAGTLTQSIYYARNIAGAAAGANAVTVAFTLAANYPDIRVLEYSGLDTVSPVDVTAAATGTATTSSTPAVVTTHAPDLLFAANTVATWTAGAGTGWKSRVVTTPDGDLAEDRVVSTIGSYSATAPLGGGGPWVMQVVAMRGK
ncbi:MAG TPA: fibronectin type III domain-containing protein, partial [Vicinamibacteria bacterium]|nr:fibronectin type III domain-containing protein [Vicinamibacteria bacterium]